MIKIENIETYGWEAAIRGMRNAYNSWEKSDSKFDCEGCHKDCFCFKVGDNDLKLMMNLANAGDDHGKFLRMITVYMDITAPLYWWKQFDTYKVGSVSLSCSTMHTIMDKQFTVDDFSLYGVSLTAFDALEEYLYELNRIRTEYIAAKERNDKEVYDMSWNDIIKLLPESYNQKRTVQLNYQILRHVYKSRKDHKLQEWNDFREVIKELPYSELITSEGNK